MRPIVPRSCQPGNARWCYATTVIALTLVLGACAVRATTPAQIVFADPHRSNGTAVAFNATADILASASADGWLRLRRLPHGENAAAWRAHDGSVHGLAFFNDSIASAGYDGTIAKWTLRGELITRSKTPAPITDMATDDAAGRIVTGHTDGAVRIWRLADLALEATTHPHTGAVRAVAWHRATDRLASSGRDGRVFVWRAGQPAQALAPPPTDAHDLTFSPDGTYLLGGGWFKLFRWRLADGHLDALATEHRGIVTSIQFLSDGRTLATISRQTDSAVHFIDAATGASLQRFQPHEYCGAAVRVASDGSMLATTSDDANVQLWDLRRPLPPRTTYP